MSFGDVIRYGATPSGYPGGVGGTNNVIWLALPSTIYELSITDFSQIKSNGIGVTIYGVGGDNNKIWASSPDGDVLELSTTDFSIVQQNSAPKAGLYGAGGDNTHVWACNTFFNTIKEYSNSDLSLIRSSGSPSSPNGAGGTGTVIWLCGVGAKNTYELSVTDFSIIRSASTPHTAPRGMGGDDTTIWHTDDNLDRIYELDAAYVPPTYTISGNVKDSDGNNLDNVTITLEDGTNYSTSTNVNGNYSQVVDPDIYDVVASIPGNADQSASVDASVSDQTQDFTFPITTAPHDKAIRLKERYLLE